MRFSRCSPRAANIEQRFGARRNRLALAVQHQRAHTLRERRAARLAREDDLDPAASSDSRTNFATVDLPAPSMPSSVMNRPGIMDRASAPDYRFAAGRAPCDCFNAREESAYCCTVLLERLREVMRASAVAGRDEEYIARVVRLNYRHDRFTPRQGNRRRRQAPPRV